MFSSNNINEHEKGVIEGVVGHSVMITSRGILCRGSNTFSLLPLLMLSNVKSAV